MVDNQGVKHNGISEIDGRGTIYFEDPVGQRLALIYDGGSSDPPQSLERSSVPEPPRSFILLGMGEC